MIPDQGKMLFNLKVLIVDDNSSVRLILEAMLKEYSREIIFADNGVEAVTSFGKNPDTDLILMDVYMHKMDGFEATKRIREMNKDVIIFVMTAAALSELVEDFSGTTINDYFPKPLNKAYLHQLIVKHFGKKM